MLLGVGGSYAGAAPVRYGLFNGQNGDGEYKIGAFLIDPDGTIHEYASNPVLTKGSGFESAHVKDPWLMWDGSQYVMYYSGYNGSAYRIGRATASAYTGSWTKYGSNPVLGLGSSGAFDDSRVLFPTVLYEPDDTGREWKMWYTGLKVSDGRYRTGYAWSTDGLAWTKVGQVLDVGAGGTWDDEGAAAVAILKEGATYYLFYGGTSDPAGDFFWQGGYATFTDPEGTYTKGAGNPTLHYINASDPSASQPLGSTASSGVTVIHPGDTSHYAVHQAVVLGDTSSETEIHTVASIDSGTQLTFAEATASTFTNADGARLRPFDYLSVQPRHVRRAAAGGYEMFAAVFQPIADLSFGGTGRLREGALRYTSPTLDGSWTRDDTTGLMFPMYPAHTGWHQFSAENPSVIAAPA
jgi:hypothetical protein